MVCRKSVLLYFVAGAWALGVSVPARAVVYNVSFSGLVYQTIGSTDRAVGDTIAGHFAILDGISGNFSTYL